MSLIRIDIDGVRRSVATNFNSIDSKMLEVKLGVSSVRTSLDRKIFVRRNINGNLTNTLNSLKSIITNLERLHSLINQSMNRYADADQQVKAASLSLAASGKKIVEFYPNQFFSNGSRNSYLYGMLFEKERQREITRTDILSLIGLYYSGIAVGGMSSVPKGQKKVKWDGDGYLTGDLPASKNKQFKADGGGGYYEYSWVGLEGFKKHEQLGGGFKASGIHSKVELDTKVVDGEFKSDIGYVEGKAMLGGENGLPILKGEAKVLTYEAKIGYDKDADYVGGLGLSGTADVLKANAFAGIDNSTVGVGAKASVAEVEGAFRIPLPFTDYNLKLIGGASAFGAGGEVKVGKETSIDLRFIFGAKIGFGFEK